MARRGLRVLAVATRTLPGEAGTEKAIDTASAEELETRLHLLGLVGLQDPPCDGSPTPSPTAGPHTSPS
jgi:magnesium-transporting ATPase (P-type)